MSRAQNQSPAKIPRSLASALRNCTRPCRVCIVNKPTFGTARAYYRMFLLREHATLDTLWSLTEHFVKRAARLAHPA